MLFCVLSQAFTDGDEADPLAWHIAVDAGGLVMAYIQVLGHISTNSPGPSTNVQVGNLAIVPRAAGTAEPCLVPLASFGNYQSQRSSSGL